MPVRTLADVIGDGSDDEDNDYSQGEQGHVQRDKFNDSREPSKVYDAYFCWAKAPPQFREPYDHSKCGKWMLFYHVSLIDDAWRRARQLLQAGRLRGVHTMKVSTALPNPNAFDPSMKVLFLYCGAEGDKAATEEVGHRILAAMSYTGPGVPTRYKRFYWKSDRATLEGQYAVRGHRNICTYSLPYLQPPAGHRLGGGGEAGGASGGSSGGGGGASGGGSPAVAAAAAAVQVSPTAAEPAAAAATAAAAAGGGGGAAGVVRKRRKTTVAPPKQPEPPPAPVALPPRPPPAVQQPQPQPQPRPLVPGQQPQQLSPGDAAAAAAAARYEAFLQQRQTKKKKPQQKQQQPAAGAAPQPRAGADSRNPAQAAAEAATARHSAWLQDQQQQQPLKREQQPLKQEQRQQQPLKQQDEAHSSDHPTDVTQGEGDDDDDDVVVVSLQQQQQQQEAAETAARRAAAAAATLLLSDAPAAAAWSCSACTYRHSGPEAAYLACAVCGTQRY